MGHVTSPGQSELHLPLVSTGLHRSQSEQILGLQLEPSRKQQPLTVDLSLEGYELRAALAAVADGLPDKTAEKKRQILQELDPDLPREFSVTCARISLVVPHKLG